MHDTHLARDDVRAAEDGWDESGGDIADLAAFISSVKSTGYAFTTVTPKTHARVNARIGNAIAKSRSDVFGWSRPFPADLFSLEVLDEMRGLGLVESRADGFLASRVRLSTLRNDLLMHSAFPTDAADAVFFGPDTYKFVDAIEHMLGRHAAGIERAADICAGAGPGAISIARAVPDAHVVMADINPRALRYGAANAKAGGYGKVTTCLSDKLNGLAGDFDLIVSHPPYLVDATQRAYRHGGGIYGADLALAITDEALQRLTPGGTVLIFTGVAIVSGNDPFKACVTARAQSLGLRWTYREVDPDVFGEELASPAYADVDRIALVVFEATRPDRVA